MTLFPEISMVVLAIGCVLTTGFFAVLILPDIFLTLFYLTPKTLGHIYAKQLRSQALWPLIRKPFVLLICAGLMFACVFLFDFKTGEYLITSEVACVCWALFIPTTLWMLISKRKDHLSRYYTGIYMEYLTETEHDNFIDYIKKVDSFSIHDARKELENSSLSFLEKRALNERIFLLQGADADKH